MLRLETPPALPYGWRFGIIIRESDMTVHGWLLWGKASGEHSGTIEELVHAGSLPELKAQALWRIAQAMPA